MSCPTRTATGGSGPISISVDRNQIAFGVDGVWMTARRIEGQFPNFRSLRPEGFEHEVRLPKAELADVVRRVGVFARHNAPLRLAFAAGELTISAQTPDVGDARESMPAPFTGDPFGYNKARRDWARQLNIDPYTSNPVLRPLLDNASAASFAGSFAINTAIGAVSMGANLVVGFDTDVRDAVWNQPAVDLARQNESRLLAMGVSGRTTRDFLRNRWFTPSLQTALVVALGKMGGIAGVESVILVASQVQGLLPDTLELAATLVKGEPGRPARHPANQANPASETEVASAAATASARASLSR